VVEPPPVAQRLPILRDYQGNWIHDEGNQCPGEPVALNDEMKEKKAQWTKKE
jgi:hypothetical protein